jgi:agmatine deiminase
MPAEWEPHASTWMAWPHYRGDWPGKFDPIPWVYAEIIRHLGRHERIDLIVNSAASQTTARKVLEKADAPCNNVHFHQWPTNRVWTRDSGCTFVIADARVGTAAIGGPVERSSRAVEGHGLSRASSANKKGGALAPEVNLAAVTWRFNAWAKYSNYRHDAKIGARMAKAVGANKILPLYGKSHLILEGGSLDVNGRGTLLTTEECLLSQVQQRNPAMNRAAYEKLFSDCLGISNVIWLGSGIAGDDTHGHIDDITRFVSPDTVVTAVESDPGDPNYEPLRDNVRRLREAADQDGKSLAIIELPMPGAVVFERRRLPASYANFYIANGLVLVPVFNDPNDRVALDILADLFPDREIVGIYSGDLIWGFGAMHCMTQQQPL